MPIIYPSFGSTTKLQHIPSDDQRLALYKSQFRMLE
jgi:hypothetical protein